MAKTRRVAVVTGGANGLGRASAFRLAEAGRAIAIWDQDREEAMLLICWATREDWKSIPKENIAFVQKQFEELARDGTGQLSGNPFPLQSEGELFLQ